MKDGSQMLPLQSLSPEFCLFPQMSHPLLPKHNTNMLQSVNNRRFFFTGFTFSIANLTNSNAFIKENKGYS